MIVLVVVVLRCRKIFIAVCIILHSISIGVGDSVGNGSLPQTLTPTLTQFPIQGIA